MKLSKNLFPYPILSNFNDDYVDSVFDVEYSTRNEGFLTRYIDIKVVLEDEKIEELLDKKIAKMVCHIECPNTGYRELIEIKDNELSFKLDIDYMRNELYLNTMVILNKDLKEYTNKNINKNYYGKNFKIKNLNKGNIIALSKFEEIKIVTNLNDFEDIPSIISVGQSTGSNKMIVDLDSDIILVKLPKKEYYNYVNLSQTEFADIIMCATILPVLVYSLDYLAEGDRYLDLDWCKVIQSKIREKGLEIKDINKVISSIELAQEMLEMPLERSLNDLKNINVECR